MSSLRERYFVDPLKSEDDTKEMLRERWAAQARFINDEYLKEEFIPWLEGVLEAHEVEPGTHETMLANTGVRKGLKIALGQLNRIRRNVEELQKNA